MTHVHEYDWTKTQPYIRECTVCQFSPDSPAWRVIVTGARNHPNRTMIWDALDTELAYARSIGLPIVVVEGQCPYGGADLFAEQWTQTHDAFHDPFPAPWKALGKRAGPHRNQRMVDAGGNKCLGFPTAESRGTYDCLRRAEDAGIPIRVYN